MLIVFQSRPAPTLFVVLLQLLLVLSVVVVVVVDAQRQQADIVNDNSNNNTVERNSSDHGNNALSISYILEPFEGPKSVLLADLDFISNNVHEDITVVEESSAMFGTQAIRLDYQFNSSSSSTSTSDSVFVVRSTLPHPRLHHCRGGKYISFWYQHRLMDYDDNDDQDKGKQQQPVFEIRFLLLRQAARPGIHYCRIMNCAEQLPIEEWEYNEVIPIVSATLSLDPNTCHRQGENDWHEIRLEVSSSAWKRRQAVPNSEMTSSNFVLDRIKGWHIEMHVKRPAIKTDEIFRQEGSFLLDQISILGGEELIGAAFHVDAWTQALLDGSIVPIYGSDESRDNTSQALVDGTFNVEYVVEQTETWGGFIQYLHIAPSRSYYNLSMADAVAIDYHVTMPSSTPGRVHFRILLLDESDCTEMCSMGNGTNLETYYSFHFILDDDQGAKTIAVELVGDNQVTSPFWRTGWFGTLGNNVLDKDNIKGFKFDFAIDSAGEDGDLASGAIEFRDLRALSTFDKSSQAQCTNDDAIRFVIAPDGSTEFRRVEFMARDKCCEVCQADPSCVYAMAFRHDCFITNRPQPQSIKLIRTDYEASEYFFFAKDTTEGRGDFCTVCECIATDRTIDCRGQDLVIIPKTFPIAQSLLWSPQVLDLRDNPGLVVVLWNSFEALTTLEEIRLPSNVAYIAPSALKGLPLLQTISFQGDRAATLPASAVQMTRPPSSITNVITEPSGAFSDVCCSSEPFPVTYSKTGGTLSFCNMTGNVPGVDSIYEEFHSYEGEVLSVIQSSSSFMYEAAESAAKCAEYCSIMRDCRYFTYDARFTLTEALCYHLRDLASSTYVCCNPEQFADVNSSAPGWISGRVPRTRCEVDGARVFIYSKGDLVLSEATDYTAEFDVRLGRTPLRGAVWITPRVPTWVADREISFTPPTVVLYNNETVATVLVSLTGNSSSLANRFGFRVGNDVEACDAAFLTGQDSCASAEDLEVYVKVVIPQDVPRSQVVVSVAVLGGLVVIFVIILSLTYAEQKRRQADAVWLVQTSELKFSDPPEVIGRGTFGLVLLAEYRGTQVAVKKVIPPHDHEFWDNASATLGGGTGAATLGEGTGLDRRSGLATIPRWESFRRSLNADESRMKSSREGSTLRLNSHRQDTHLRLKASFVKEMRHLSKLRHPCITTVMGAVLSRKEEPLLVMEFMDHGSLYDLLHNETVILEGCYILPILRDIAQGVRFLHAAMPQVIHGDLKAQNILVDAKFRAKVADFGLSQKKVLGATGTPYWMAPELLRGESNNTSKSDVYSFGIILYELYSREDPYNDEEMVAVLEQVADPAINKRPPIPLSCPSKVQSIMTACNEADPENRPSFEQLDLLLKDLEVANVEPGQTNRSLRRVQDNTDKLLDEVFPPRIAKALREGRKVEAETRDVVTIFFSDIVGFTNIASELPPLKVADMLDRLYRRFDALSHGHGVFKVETIGDSWMGVTNLISNQPDHAKRMAKFAVDAVAVAREVPIDRDNLSLGCVDIRIGFHSGPVVANVVGSRNPRYCLFGDSVNTASRMESHSECGRIQCSEASAKLLQVQEPSIQLSCRGLVEVKGKGMMKTYWVDDGGKHAVEKPRETTS